MSNVNTEHFFLVFFIDRRNILRFLFFLFYIFKYNFQAN